MIAVVRMKLALIFRKTTSVMKTCSLIACVSLSFATMTSVAQVADAGPDTTLCVNFYTIQGSPVPLGATGTWTVVMGCGTLNTPNAPNCPVTDLCIGSNVFEWTVDDGGTITSDIVVITVYDANMPPANAGPDTITVIAPQTTAFLSGSPSPIYPATCLWTVVAATATIADPTDPNTMVAGLAVGDNIFCWTCDNGPCGITSDTLVIQMLMTTGLDEAVPTRPAFAWDPVQHRLQYLGTGRISGLLMYDAQGKAMPLDRNTGQGPWQIPMLKPGVYLIRAAVDGSAVKHRFVVAD